MLGRSDEARDVWVCRCKGLCARRIKEWMDFLNALCSYATSLGFQRSVRPLCQRDSLCFMLTTLHGMQHMQQAVMHISS
jgi:hypothetical protein